MGEKGNTQTVLLELKNGDRLSGVILSETGAEITLSNSALGRLAVPWAQVEKRSTNTFSTAKVSSTIATNGVSPSAEALSPVEQRQLHELQASYLANQLSAQDYYKQRTRILAKREDSAVDASNARAQGVPAPALVNPAVSATSRPSQPKVSAPKYLTGEAMIGTDLAYSEKDRQLYTGRVKLTYVRKPLRSSFDHLFTYGRTEGELSANRMDASLKTDYDLNPKVYALGILGGGYDEVRKVDWRYEVSPGVGRHLVRLTNFVVNAEVGTSYQVQNFEGNRQDDLFHYRLAQDLRWNIGNQFTFDEKVEYLPQWNEPKEFKLRVEANLRYWLRANLSLNLTLINIFDTITAPGVQQNDLQIKSTVGVKF